LSLHAARGERAEVDTREYRRCGSTFGEKIAARLARRNRHVEYLAEGPKK